MCRVSFLPLLPALELTSLDHQVVTTTGENKIGFSRVLHVLCCTFLFLLPAPGLTSLDHQVITSTTGENNNWVLSSLASRVVLIFLFFSYLPLGHRVDTVTGENKIWRLSSFVSCFFCSLTCPGLEGLSLHVRTKYGDYQVLQVLHRTSVLRLPASWLRSLYKK